jgi:acetoacetyl-CoA synthetase
MGSAGAPVAPELYDYIYRDVKHGIYVSVLRLLPDRTKLIVGGSNNGSGGTDICAILAGNCIALPVWYSEMAMPAMGARIQAFSDEGQPVKAGDEGHLVLTQPLPNQPIYFWDDPGDKKYFSSYFDSFPNNVVWNQSDWIVISPTSGGINILGRSDGVLKCVAVLAGASAAHSVFSPQGVRFGSAE